MTKPMLVLIRCLFIDLPEYDNYREVKTLENMLDKAGFWRFSGLNQEGLTPNNMEF